MMLKRFQQKHLKFLVFLNGFKNSNIVELIEFSESSKLILCAKTAIAPISKTVNMYNLLKKIEMTSNPCC